jgi:hypothetical protein
MLDGLEQAGIAMGAKRLSEQLAEQPYVVA